MSTNSFRMYFSFVFLFSFLVNLIWENAHAGLYVAHLNTPITEMTLIVASLGDAVIISIFALVFYLVPFLAKRLWLVMPIGIVTGVLIELYALQVHRWSYNEHIPLIPWLHVGISPALQLGILGYIVLTCCKLETKHLV